MNLPNHNKYFVNMASVSLTYYSSVPLRKAMKCYSNKIPVYLTPSNNINRGNIWYAHKFNPQEAGYLMFVHKKHITAIEKLFYISLRTK